MATKIKPLVDTLNGFNGIEIEEYSSGDHPFIRFSCPLDLAQAISLRIRDVWFEGRLHYWWEAVGRFEADGALHFSVWAKQGFVDKYLWRKRIKRDVAVLAKELHHIDCDGHRFVRKADVVSAGAVAMARIAVLAVVLTLVLSACARKVELQKDGSGSDEMLKSPCACVPLPYEAPNYTWSVG